MQFENVPIEDDVVSFKITVSEEGRKTFFNSIDFNEMFATGCSHVNGVITLHLQATRNVALHTKLKYDNT